MISAIRIILLTTVVMSGCNRPDVSINEELSGDLSRLRDYRWAGEGELIVRGLRVDRAELMARIREWTDQALSERGYRRRDNGAVDFTLSYQAAMEFAVEHVAMRGNRSFHGFGETNDYDYDEELGWGEGRVEYDEKIDHCTLTLTILSTDGQPHWTATATSKLRHPADDALQQRALLSSIQKLTSRLPAH